MKKKCSKCGEIKTIDLFYKHKTSRLGCRAACVECERKRCIEDYKENRDKRNSNRRLCYKANAEKMRERSSQYYYLNQNRVIEKTKAYRGNNKEKIKANSKTYYKNNMENRLRLAKDRRITLKDCYVKFSIRRTLNVNYKDITSIMIKLKRQQLIIYRQLKEATNGTA